MGEISIKHVTASVINTSKDDIKGDMRTLCLRDKLRKKIQWEFFSER